MEVETRADVFDDEVVVGVVLLEELDLALEVAGFFLFWRRDAGVEDEDAALVCRLRGLGHAEEDVEVAFVVAVGRERPCADANGSDLPLRGPLGQGGAADAILFQHSTRREIFVAR